MCRCGHPDHQHGQVTFPAHREPCDMCVRCDRRRQTGKGCCLTPKPCLCIDFQEDAA